MAPPVSLLGRVRGRLAAEGMSAVPGQTCLGTAHPQPQYCLVFCALPEMLLAEQCSFSKVLILACSLWEKCVFSGLSPYFSCCHFSLPCLYVALGSLCQKQGAGRREELPWPGAGTGNSHRLHGAGLCTLGALINWFLSPFAGTEDIPPPCAMACLLIVGLPLCCSLLWTALPVPASRCGFA